MTPRLDPLAPPVLAADAVAQKIWEHFQANKPEPASFPMMASRVLELAEREDVDATQLSHVIERDPAICTAVLAMANSAANRAVVQIANVRDAVSRLGLRNVANVALGVACKSLFDMELRAQQQLFAGHWERLFHAAMTEAFACSFVALKLGRQSSDGYFILGLLHDLGKSLALRSLATLLVGGAFAPLPESQDLDELLEVHSAEIGALALEAFNMPDALCQALRKQDQLTQPGDPDTWSVLRLVSNLNRLRMETLDTEKPLAHLTAAAALLNLDSVKVLKFAQELCEHSAQVGMLFSTTDGADESGFIDFLERELS